MKPTYLKQRFLPVLHQHLADYSIASPACSARLPPSPNTAARVSLQNLRSDQVVLLEELEGRHLSLSAASSRWPEDGVTVVHLPDQDIWGNVVVREMWRREKGCLK